MPLGIYTVCTYRMADALRLPFLQVIPRYAVYVARSAWAATAIGLLIHMRGFAVAAAVRAR